MIATDRAPADAAPSAARWQFSTRSLLWLMATTGMCLAYARLFGEAALWVMAATPLMALPLGCLAGAAFGRIGPAVYWALVGAVLAGVCAVAAPIGEAQRYFWPLLGALVGAQVGSRVAPRVPPAATPRMQWFDADWIVTPLLPASVLLAFIGFFRPGPDTALDLGVAIVAAAGLAALVQLVEWRARRCSDHGTTRDAWAAGMILAVIVGNLAARALS